MSELNVWKIQEIRDPAPSGVPTCQADRGRRRRAGRVERWSAGVLGLSDFAIGADHASAMAVLTREWV